jgi:two-component system NtrC family sensor kinase
MGVERAEMLTAQRHSIRLLQGVLIGAAALPMLLFCFAAWQSQKDGQRVAQSQIERSRDVLNEHALKVFEAVERGIAEINEIIRDMSDDEIRTNQQKLHDRLERMVSSSPEMKSFWIFDRNGRALVSSLEFPAPAVDFADRDYFGAHVEHDIGTYIGEVLRPRAPYGGAPFFGVSRRRISSDVSFTGVIQASVLPEYFEGFYAKIGQTEGSYFSLIRGDGLILARYPRLDRDTRLPAQGNLIKAFNEHPDEGTVSVVSLIDGVERRVSYLKLPSLPVYVLSGMETAAIRNEWISQMSRHLIFGIPATAALIVVIALALRRTRNLYEEAKRRQAAEGALKQAQRLEALGQLTGGVAHDFNNLLMVVGGSARKLKRTNKDPTELRSLQMIDAAVQKGEGLTRKLLAFSRRQSLSPEVINLPDFVSKLRGVLEQSVPGDIEIEISAPTGPVAVKIDPDELEIALLNLTLNARDAMPDGGRIKITIRTAPAVGTEGLNEFSGNTAVIEFADNGHGVPEAIQERIFEPFFTTKAVDKGTGLGLSQIYGFVQQSNGTITFSSEVGAGTTFRLSLPICEETPKAKPAELVDASPKDIEPATVLLVEDHPDVSIVARDYLEQYGCKVVQANSAEGAVEALNRRQDIDLVLSDIVMPGMSGLELGRLVREHHPEIPVVLASGYSDKAAVATSEGFPLIRKPYSPETLRHILAQILGEARKIKASQPGKTSTGLRG